MYKINEINSMIQTEFQLKYLKWFRGHKLHAIYEIPMEIVFFMYFLEESLLKCFKMNKFFLRSGKEFNSDDFIQCK